jgi:hypothetical protein
LTRPAAGTTVGVLLVGVYLAGLFALANHVGIFERLQESFKKAQLEERHTNHSLGRETTARGRTKPGAHKGGRETATPQELQQGPLDGVEAALSKAVRTAWWVFRLALLSTVLACGASIGLRAVARPRRQTRTGRFEIRLGREDLATPYQREKMFDAFYGQLAERWWVRLSLGQPSIALEVHHLPDATERFALAATPRHAAMLEGRLLATYPDVRLVPIKGAPTWSRKVIRLKKRRPFVDRIQTVKDDEQALIEPVVSTMARLGEPASVQILLTPAPRAAHALSRRLLKMRERELTRTERRDPLEIGVDSVVEDKELKGALETQHRSLFWAEIRVCSTHYEVAKAVSGLFSEARSENELVPRHARLRGGLYARRIALAANNPLPSFMHGVLSSSELAALWSLPRQRVKTAQLVRSPLRRAPAPPEIAREPEVQIMRDERGPVGLFEQDRKYGLAFIGGQGVGKTSAMARTIEIDARDSNAALIVLDPKHDLAEHALSLIPEDRTVWYMDLARPEVGINPLRIDAEPSAVADVVLQAMREAHEPGAILSQSDEFLRNAALAVCGVEEEPTLWHMYELLSPRRAPYRLRVADRLDGMEGMAAVARYWSQTFPDRWMDSRTHMAGQLAAPLNKINRLLTSPSVDVALRHPFALDLARVIRGREVLVVNGALGEVGEQNAVVVLQFLLQLVHQAMKQQQRLSQEERVRVCLKIDEAHLVLTPSFATMLALHRAAGPLEVTAAWQYSEQVEDRSIRAGLKSLLRSRSMFAMGEVSDARDQAEVAMEVYSDLIRAERDDRERARFGPDDIVRLPTFAALNSWVAGGARQTAFLAGTLPVDGSDTELRARHLARQCEAGAFWPATLDDPLEEVGAKREVREERPGDGRSEADETERPDAGRGAEAPVPEPALADVEEERPEPDKADEQPGADEDDEQPESNGRRSSPAEADVPATYSAVHRTNVVGLRWDQSEVDPGVAQRLEPQVRDLEIVRALWRHEVLLLSHMWKEWWPDRAIRSVQVRLVRLVEAGWLRRFQLQASKGRYEAGYVLARAGFVAGQAHHGPEGPYIPKEAKWEERRIADYRTLEHRLQTNAWVLCFRRLVDDHAVEWRGEREGRVEVPTKLEDGRRVRIGAEDLRVERYRRVRDLRTKEFGRVWPDATVTMDMPHRGRRFDLMLELDRTGKPTKNLDKFHRYDALLTGWWHAVERYRKLGEAPAVVFICIDEHNLVNFMRAADREVTGRLARPGTAEATWPYPGRERMLFVSERDVHEGSLRAFKLPIEPSDARGRGELESREVRLPGGRREGG